MGLKWWTWLIIGLCAGIAIASIFWIALTAPAEGVEYVALVELSGTISYSESPLALFTGETLTPSRVESLLNKIEYDPFAEAVVIVINSPGGSAAASEKIYHMIEDLSEKKVVVAYIAEYGASGGYYIALPSDEIVASPNALTGSVGAVSIVVNYAELMRHLGIKAEAFKSGRLKDIGSPWREMTDEEKEIMQSIVNSIAENFQEKVLKHRGDKINNWEEVLTARPYLGVQALKLGLVDEIGSMDDAVNLARKLANLPENAPARWIKPKKPSLFELLLGEGGESNAMKLSYEVLMMWPLPAVIEPDQIIKAEAVNAVFP